MTSSVENLLVLAAYFAFVMVLAFAFKDFALTVFSLEKDAYIARESHRECFFEEEFFLSLRNGGTLFTSKCGVAMEGGELA